ncbi:MAG: hypothetical protein NTZ43_09730 [Gemmatimonadetes bacterium]|nr:hypothetical protein [Gemmatimonadota bacterium]
MRSRHLSSLSLGAVLCLVQAPRAAQAQIAVLSSTVEERVAFPGDRYTGTIVIGNSTTRPQVARIFQTDYSFLANGTSAFDEPGTMQRSNANWITPQTTRVVVPAGTQIVVPYSVLVPSRDSLTGSYWSTIMVEGAPNESAESAKPGAPGVAVGAIIRYAIQVTTHVRDQGARTVQFENERVSTTSSNASMFDVDVANAGERAYRPILWIEVYDADGALRAKAKQSRGLLYPGSSLRQHFDLGTLPTGRYKAVLFADTGSDAVFAKQFSINF